MTSKVKTLAVKPAHHGYEFFGPPGVTVLTCALPPLVYAFNLLCNDISGCPAPSLLHPTTFTLDKLKKDIGWKGVETIFNWESVAAALGWYGLSILCYAILPADEVDGTELYNGGRLKYRLNIWNTSIFIGSLLAAGTFSFGASFPVWTFISDNFVQLFTANLIIAFLLACYVYVASFTIKHIDPDRRCLALGGNSGNIIYDWFIGRELNPRIKIPGVPEIDIKAFMEMRPGLLGWILFDFAFMAAQYRNYGYITDSMLITVIAQSCYVFDSYYMEPAILTTMDITTDGFGFMLSFGDVCWVPFVYSLQARYLATYPVHLGPYILLTFGMLATGYYIFRSSNNEKNRFRTNPDDPSIAHLEYMDTKVGSKLLVSGWWGRARHINYIGDWTLSWSYCLPTGIAGYQIVSHSIVPVLIPEGGYNMAGRNDALIVVYPGEAKGWGMIITYFFMVYFAVLLIHRERRDETKCKSKYGEDWEEYKRRVPWRIIPYVY